MVLTQAEAEKYLRDFARRLQERRKQLGLNTTQLSERTGIARQTIESSGVRQYRTPAVGCEATRSGTGDRPRIPRVRGTGLPPRT